MFGEKLVKARTAKNLSQEQLAEKLYVTRQAVSRWENNKTQPDLQTLGRICTLLGVSADYFINYEIETVEYKSLPYAKKLLLYHDFIKENFGDYILSCLFNALASISCCVGVAFTVTIAFIDIFNGSFGGRGGVFWTITSLGVILFAAALVAIALFRSNKLSVLFNRWLADRSIVRTKIFI